MAMKILILAANPKNTSRLRLDEEIREIENGLQRASRRTDFVLKSQLAARPVDVRRVMLDFKPNIVHFSGHGAEEGIAFEDETGSAKLVNSETLSSFFKLFADKIDCILLNACYTEGQAEAISQYIPYVIGAKNKIPDAAAIEFAIAFYDALGAGETIEFSYKLACNAIEWLNLPKSLMPVLKRGTKVSSNPKYSVGVFGPRKLIHKNSEKETYRAFVWSKGIFDFRMIVTYQEQDSVRDLLNAVFRRNNSLYNFIYESESQGWGGLIQVFLEDDEGNRISLRFNDNIPKNIQHYSQKDVERFYSTEKTEIPQLDQPSDIRIYIAVYFPGT